MGEKTTILVIEDNQLNLTMAIDILEDAGFQTLQALDAKAGIELALEQHPDVILMDLHLPLMDGFEAARILKSDPRTADIIILAFTALAMDFEQRKALESGCSGIISKPVDVEGMLKMIHRHLQESSAATLRTALPSSHGVAESPASLQHQQDQAHDEMEQFLFSASHDLQAPLRKIQKFSELLHRSAQSELSPENFALLEGIDRSAEQMHGLLSDLLTLSRINRKGGAFSRVELSGVMKKVLARQQPLIEASGAQVRIGPMGALDGDESQLERLLEELLENALKFHRQDTPPEVAVTFKVLGDTCEITVADQGVGFSPEYLERIFQPFQRLHGSSTYSGTGMGLAIAKKIVERHGGSLTAKSQPGQGAAFTVTLPLRQAAFPEPASSVRHA